MLKGRGALAEAHGVAVHYNGADLGVEAEVDALTKATEDAFGGVDILVNNAVIRYFHTIDEFDRKDWQHAMAVNVTAPFLLTQNVLPGMRKRGWGRIVNFSLVLGLAARSGRADYVTAKTAMWESRGRRRRKRGRNRTSPATRSVPVRC